jgi:hypothetical protein
MPALRLEDSDDRGFLTVGLKDLLNVVRGEGPDLVWVLQYLQVSGDLGNGWTVQKFEKATRQAPFGLRLTWAELVHFAQRLTQVQDGIVIGLAHNSAPPAINGNPTDGDAWVIFEAVDSSYWEVRSRDEEVLNRIRSSFRKVSVVPTTP